MNIGRTKMMSLSKPLKELVKRKVSNSTEFRVWDSCLDSVSNQIYFPVSNSLNVRDGHR